MKRPKLFYVPGMISLLVVPVLFYVYQPTEKRQTQLKFFVPREDQPKDRGSSILYYSRSAVMATLKDKKINTVYLDENHALNENKLKFIGQEALKLKFYHDTTQVIKVHLSTATNYGEFVQLVNIMHRDNHKRYTWLDDDFYIFGEEPPEPETLQMPCLLCNDVIPTLQVQPANTWQDKLFEKLNNISSFIKNNALLLSAFVLLIIVPAIIKRKRGY
jgi:hypothetical protein